MSSVFGPKKPLFGPYTYRVKRNVNGDTLIAVYHGAKRIAHMDAYWAYSMRSIEEHEAEETQRAAGGRRRRLVCASDLRALGAGGKYPNVLTVGHAYIDDDAYKGKGIGRAMYEAMMVEGYAVRETRVGGSPGPMFFIPDECKGAGNTSAEAQRVWASLVRDYPSRGTSIRVDAPPIIGSRAKPNPRRRNPAASDTTGRTPPKNLRIEFYDEDGDNDPRVERMAEAAWKIALASPIRILSNKRLSAIAVLGRKVVGAAWYSVAFPWYGDEPGQFSFDIVVAPEAQGKGVGDALVGKMLDQFGDLAPTYGDDEMGGGLVLNVEVVNPAMERILARRGFRLRDEEDPLAVRGVTMMTRPNRRR